MLSTHIVFLTG